MCSNHGAVSGWLRRALASLLVFGSGCIGNIDADGTTIYLDNLWWTNTTAQLVDCVNSSLTLLNSYIPGGAGIEPVHFNNMPAGGHALIKGNIFDAPRGYNDSIDLTGGNRPGSGIGYGRVRPILGGTT